MTLPSKTNLSTIILLRHANTKSNVHEIRCHNLPVHLPVYLNDLRIGWYAKSFGEMSLFVLIDALHAVPNDSSVEDGRWSIY